MRDLYDRLIDEGEAGILRLIEERTQEGLQLDFKQKRDPARGLFEEKDKQILAKAVSGFANSAGGLIVWGVNAKPGPDGVDCAQAPAAPISEIERFMSEATRLVGQLIQPRHDGIQIAPIKSSSHDGSGYLLIYIERSDRRPHRSEAKDQKQYYKRAGESFFEMEHYDIEDAFSRSAAPVLDLSWTNSSRRVSEILHFGCPLFGLVNKSSVSARYPYVTIRNLNGLVVDALNMVLNPSFKFHQSYGEYHFVGGSDAIIHPEMHLSIFDLRIFYNKKADVGWTIDWRSADSFSPTLDYVVGCEGGQAKRGSLAFPTKQFSLPS